MRLGKWSRRRSVIAASAVAAGSLTLAGGTAPASLAATHGHARTATPIKHVVVLFDENNSFDHYFGTYPKAANTDGTKFFAKRNTPHVNGLTTELLTRNPNKFNPKRLTHEQPVTCDQDHNYIEEQRAVDGGKMDKFVENTEVPTCTDTGAFGAPGLVLDYYDGNSATALWNYAQNYSMSDNSWDPIFGPSTPGALDLISGQTHGGISFDPVTHKRATTNLVVAAPDKHGVGTLIHDPDPLFDDCSDENHTTTDNLAAMTGRNVGDLLNAKHVTWGWFEGGFRPTGHKNGLAVCGATHKNVKGGESEDYASHHEPFQYYKSTANPKHLAPSSVAEIGHNGRANHQYDLTDFDRALRAGRLPAVSFLKAAQNEDGHPGNSGPLDEQHFIVRTINKLQKSPEWRSTAVVIAYDDSDGWYDHQAPTILNGSTDPATDTAFCATARAAGGFQDRCGPSQRLPLLVVSPFSKVNHVDHSLTMQTSVLRFIEDNWRLGRIGNASFDQRSGSLNGMFDFARPHARKLILDPVTGAPVRR